MSSISTTSTAGQGELPEVFRGLRRNFLVSDIGSLYSEAGSARREGIVEGVKRLGGEYASRVANYMENWLARHYEKKGDPAKAREVRELAKDFRTRLRL